MMSATGFTGKNLCFRDKVRVRKCSIVCGCAFMHQRRQASASAVFRVVPRAGDGRTSHGKRSSPVRGTTFSDTSDSLRIVV